MNPLRIITFTTLYPNSVQPQHGIFVEQRIRRLAASGQVHTSVVAPVPWFPFASPFFGRWRDYARIPARENRHDLDVIHPRFPTIPKIGMTIAPRLLAAWSKSSLTRAIAEAGNVALIDAHYFYPDGVAAVMLARRLGLPVVVTARGTDINLIPKYAVARRQIVWAAQHADGIITVCEALKSALIDLGTAPDKIIVLRNGIDLEMFKPLRSREAIRRRLGLSRHMLLSVGHLITRKGHDIVIRALADLPDTDLIIVGSGPEEQALRKLVNALEVSDRVRFAGQIPQTQLPDYYNAADVLVLASSREGWANVLLEAMACGTPVVASNVWGTPEVVRKPAAGVLIKERTPRALALACRELLANRPRRADTRRYAEAFSWDATTKGQVDLFRRLWHRNCITSARIARQGG